MEFFGFHPLIRQWFQSRFDAPTEPQSAGWPSIAAGKPTLIAAPTGSGKTLTAFLACLDRLVKEAEVRPLPQEMRVLYVSPLRALSNDMHRNLLVPLQEISALAEANNIPSFEIRAGLRTGDTPSSQRAAITRKPPHILVTTPESLYLMLTAEKSRETLRTVETVIIDEIHALIRDKRGSHLSLSLERLESLTEHPLQRIGLSATQRPIERVSHFLMGERNPTLPLNRRKKPQLRQQELFQPEVSSPSVLTQTDETTPECEIIDVGHQRELDLAIEIPESELSAVCSHDTWAEIYQRICKLIEEHRSTLIFVNTRRLAERVTHQLTELLGEEVVSSHHGSLSADLRLETEAKLKTGQLKAVIATASLELGLDIGHIDLVIQIGSPRSIATFLQRIGRSGHSLGLIPKGRLFALTRDELIEAMSLIRAVNNGRLDTTPIPEAPLDILAQQIVAETATEDWSTDDLFDLYRQAYPYRELDRKDFDRVIQYLSEGLTSSSGRSRVYLHHDHVGKKIRARKGARLMALTNGGAIPEIASYRVVVEPEGTVVGTLDEDFAIESQRGDVFLLGNSSWQILGLRGGDVRVRDAQGAPPTVPFWEGEAPGRTWELSSEVSLLREEIEQRLPSNDDQSSQQNGNLIANRTANENGTHPLNQNGEADLIDWLMRESHSTHEAALQAVHYIAAQKAAIGVVPTQKNVVFERFFDETGGMQLVVHAPFGSRICKAWGFAMRKRFCRSFDFELQATADDNGYILTLGPQHSFPIPSLFPMLTSENATSLLEQAMFQIPLFQVRWRWNVTRSLLVQRMNNGKKVPPALQRFRADDLLTAVFPKLTGCQEEHTGDHELPDHPLTHQTMHDCLHEALDLEGLLNVLREIEHGEVQLIPRDTREPSPFSYELLNANPYAFLDGGEIQERRVQAVSQRRSLTIESVEDLGRLDESAIQQVIQEAAPLVRNADELHDLLMSRICLPLEETKGWELWYEELQRTGRATTLILSSDDDSNSLSELDNGSVSNSDRQFHVPTERLPAAEVIFPHAAHSPSVTVPETVPQTWDIIEARTMYVRGCIETCGPITAEKLASRLALTVSQTFATLVGLEGEGLVLRGQFTPKEGHSTWDAEGDGKSEQVQQGADNGDSQQEQNSEPNEHSDVEWCHRRLLSRIHRLTLNRLRKEIQPVSVETFLRYLTYHQGVLPGTKRASTDGLFEVITMLQGLDLPASCWEESIFPLRLESYSTSWLDELCLNGEVSWGRLYPPPRDPEKSRPMASLTRIAPLSFWLRADHEWIISSQPVIDVEWLSSPAVALLELLQQRGAMFVTDLKNELQMLPSQLNETLGELITRGLITADGFSGLRSLLAERSSGRNGSRNGSRRRNGLQRRRNTTTGNGRWSIGRTFQLSESLLKNDSDDSSTSDQNVPRLSQPCASNVSHEQKTDFVTEWAWQLLRRWGVIFRDLLKRESGAPSWFELLQVYRKLEARGEIRGGRFIKGVAGEQFALSESVRKLRELREDETGNDNNRFRPLNNSDVKSRSESDSEWVLISGADPLNLVGIVTDHVRVPATASNRILLRRGIPIAALQGGDIRWLREVEQPSELAWDVQERLGVGQHGERKFDRETMTK